MFANYGHYQFNRIVQIMNVLTIVAITSKMLFIAHFTRFTQHDL